MKLRNRLPRRQRALRRRRDRTVVEDALHNKPYHHGGNNAAERIPTRIVSMRRHGAWHDEPKVIGRRRSRSGYRDGGRYDGCWCWRRCGRGGGRRRRDLRAAVTNAGRSGKRHREQHAKQRAPARCSTPHGLRAGSYLQRPALLMADESGWRKFVPREKVRERSTHACAIISGVAPRTRN